MDIEGKKLKSTIVSMAEFRKIESSDTDALWRIRTEAILSLNPIYYDNETIKSWAYSPQPPSFGIHLTTSYSLLYLIDEKPLAFAFLDEAGDVVESCFVDPLYHGYGLGRCLVLYLERQACGAGKKKLSLIASLNAVPFYQALGYKIIKKDIFHQIGRLSLACVAMVKTLGRGYSHDKH